MPGSLTLELISRDTVTLRWSPPGDTGGVPLSGYIIEQQEGAALRWKVVGYADPYR